MLLRTIRGSSPTTTRLSPYSVSPNIQTLRPSGKGMEYAASAPSHCCLKGNCGTQLVGFAEKAAEHASNINNIVTNRNDVRRRGRERTM
jgi:hypothetical protein